MNKSFLVLFFKKELLFEKRSKNFCSLVECPDGGLMLIYGDWP